METIPFTLQNNPIILLLGGGITFLLSCCPFLSISRLRILLDILNRPLSLAIDHRWTATSSIQLGQTSHFIQSSEVVQSLTVIPRDIVEFPVLSLN